MCDLYSKGRSPLSSLALSRCAKVAIFSYLLRGMVATLFFVKDLLYQVSPFCFIFAVGGCKTPPPPLPALRALGNQGTECPSCVCYSADRRLFL